MANNDNFFARLTTLFRSGPSIQRFVKQTNYQLDPSVAGSVQQTYRTFGRAFGAEAKSLPIGPRSDISINRAGRYSVFETMDIVTPEISKALDVYADEIAGADERGKSFHIYAEKPEIRKALYELFYEVMDIENNIRSWIRSYMKYGDFFLYHEVVPKEGIVATIPLPVNSMERLEGFDKEDPFAIQFKSLVNKNQIYHNWQITHFRLLSNSLFYPYGTSLLDPIRRTWDQMCMAEDSMLTYRVVRSPEKRQIFVETGAAQDKDIPSFMENVKSRFRSLGKADDSTGRIDYRFNPGSVEQDIFIPMRNGVPLIKIEPLPANVNATAVEDIQYLQIKMLAGLGVPKAYLNFDDNLSSKATLAQSDIRFSRTIAALQKEIVSQFEKIAAIHLYSKGFIGEDLTAFKFRFSNPSSVAVQQRLALWATKFNIITNAKDTGIVDSYWLQKNILELGDEEIAAIVRGQRIDKLRAAELESLAVKDGTKNAQVSDNFDTKGYEVPDSGNRIGPEQDNNETEQSGFPVAVSSKEVKSKAKDNPFSYLGSPSSGNPVKPNPYIGREKHNAKRRVMPGTGVRDTAMPDFTAMLSADNKYAKDVFGMRNEFKPSISNVFEMMEVQKAIDEEKSFFLRSEIVSCFKNFDKQNQIHRTIDGRIMLREDLEKEKEEMTQLSFDLLSELNNDVVNAK